MWPAVSPSGRFVAFWTGWTNLAAPYSYSGTQVHVCDLGAPNDALDRCFVASLTQVDPSSGFALASSAAAAQRIGLAYADDSAAGYVAYQAGTSSWGGMNGAGFQVFVSPAGDPRFQMPSPSP
jgi:hypothetical protein